MRKFIDKSKLLCSKCLFLGNDCNSVLEPVTKVRLYLGCSETKDRGDNRVTCVWKLEPPTLASGLHP